MRKLLFMVMVVLAGCVWGQGVATDSITVADGGDYYEKLPFYTYYLDGGQGMLNRSQSIYPAAMLSAMPTGRITRLRYYGDDFSFNLNRTVFVKIGETAGGSFDEDSPAYVEGLRTYYTGNVEVVDGRMEIVLDSAYGYGGGNLVIEFLCSGSSNSGTVNDFFIGEEVYGAARSCSQYYSYQPSVHDFLPKVTFTYEYTPQPVPVCDNAEGVTAEESAPGQVRVTWSGEGESYRVVASRVQMTETMLDTATAMSANDTTVTFSGLEPATRYYFYVKAVCGPDNESGWEETSADVYERVDVQVSDTVCYGETEYTAKGETFELVPGLNQFSITHRDSILLRDTCWHYNVYVPEHPMVMEISDTISVDQRQPYAYTENGFSLSNPVSGDYIMTFEKMGCDSVVTLHLRVAYSAEESATICSNESYVWEGHGETAYTEAGRYTLSFVTAAGMDSVWTLVLSVNQAYALDFDTAMCSGDVILWEGETITAAGDYVAQKTTASGCDSVLTLHVAVNDTVAENITMTYCQNELDTEHAGWEPGIYHYTDTAVAENGCDSFTHYTIVINQAYALDFDTAMCSGDVIQWEGETITAAGDYVARKTAASGCDSVLTLHVAVNDTMAENITMTYCQNELDIEHAGWEPGIYHYTDTAVAENGCDSFTHYTIVINQAYDTMEVATAYQGDTIEWHGYKIACDKVGQEVYFDSLKTAEGCDSVTYLLLQVFSRESVEDAAIAPLRLAPNPVARGMKAYLDSQWSAEEMEGMMVEVVDNTGKTVECFDVSDYPIEIEASMPAGIYHVRVVTGDGKVIVGKMIVE